MNSDISKKTKKKVQKTIIENVRNENKPVKHKITNPVIENKKADESHTASDETNIDNSVITKAMADLDKRNYQEVLKKLSAILTKEKNTAGINKVNYLLGEANFGLKQYDKAISFYNRVLASKNRAEQDNAQIKIGESQLRLGQVIEAKKSFQTFVQKFPNSELLPKARKMLQQL